MASLFVLGSALTVAVTVTPGADVPASASADVAAARTSAAGVSQALAAKTAAAVNPDAIVRAGTPREVGVQASTSSVEGYGPSDLRSAYNLVSAAASGGEGATIAVISYFDDPDAESDLGVYRKQFGLPACTTANGCFRKVNQSGEASPLPEPEPPQSILDASVTQTEPMQLDMVSAICPNCHILLVEADMDDVIDMGTAVDSAVSLGAKYVVIGWTTDYGNTSLDSEYFDHPGVAITVPGYGSTNRVDEEDDFPADSPYVTSVGGTTLQPASNARGWAETPVGEPAGATATYCSQIFGKPSWQTDTGCAGRTYPDVAAVADPNTGVAFYDTALNGWGVGGGDAVSAAIVGGVYALAGTPATDTFPATYPYEHASGLYSGTVGLGTPDGTSAFTPGGTDEVSMTSQSTQYAVALPQTVSLPMGAIDSAGTPLTYTATGLPPGVSLDATTGLISGTVSRDYDGNTSVTATDAAGTSATVTFAWDMANDFSVKAPSTRQTKPDTQVSMQVPYSEPDKTATTTFSATGLPPGLTIDPGTGVISGTTTSTIGSYDVTVTAADSDGTTSTATFTWDVWNLITVTTPSVNEHSSVGVPVTPVTVSATDSATGQTLSFSAPDLPPGLSIDPKTGEISGTPTALDYPDVTITVTDGTGSAGTATIAWAVGGKITMTNPGSQTDLTGQTANLALKVTDTAAHDSLAYSVTGIPPGTEFDYSSADFSGWPTAAGVYNVSVSVTGEDGGAAAMSFTWTVKGAPSSGATGEAHLDIDGKCLDDAGNSIDTGNKIDISTCNGTGSQAWTFAEDGTLRIHGKCLDIVGTVKSGAKAELEPCDSPAGEQWVLGPHAELITLASGLCLADPGGSTTNGTQVEVAACGAGPRESWTLPPGQILAPVPGACADDYDGATGDGTKVDVTACTTAKEQRWTFEPDNTIRVSGKCMTAEGTVVLETCQSGDSAQQWALVTGNGLDTELRAGQACLSVPSMAAADGAALITGTCSSTAAQWHVW